MKAFDVVSYKGKKIVVVDISNTVAEQSIGALAEAQEKISNYPPKSVLVLMDVTGATYNKEGSQALRDFASKNTSFIKASAVVGADGMRAILLSLCVRVTGREIRSFDGREAALEWLAGH